MLALVATSVCHYTFSQYLCWQGLLFDRYIRLSLWKTDFNADHYEDIYNMHMMFLAHIWEESEAKYHHLMASLYSAAS